MEKLKIGIFDLTDCEGCEVMIINLKEEMLAILEYADIVNWRLVEEEHKDSPLDIAIVEGSAQTDDDIALLKKVRGQARYLIGLGACACIGGIPSLSGDREQRAEYFKLVYGPDYEPKAPESKPIDAYVKVDYYINGCPVSRFELERVFARIMMGEFPFQLSYPVCLECKFRENGCVLIQDKPCLGPITQAGCRAICVAEGKYCYGCQGLFKAANMEVLQTRLKQFLPDDVVKRHLNLFLEASSQYERLYG
jgi:sulfhydrogenase subunit delta